MARQPKAPSRGHQEQAAEAVTQADLKWSRVLWRLERRQERAAWEAARAAAARKEVASTRSRRSGAYKAPTQEQLECEHPKAAQWYGANQVASYRICRSCGLYLDYQVKAREAVTEKHLGKGARGAPVKKQEKEPGSAAATTPTQAARTEPPPELDLLVERMLAPVVLAQQQQAAQLHHVAM
eukprot:4859831-Lingulodinium_polyedra.AAC.1